MAYSINNLPKEIHIVNGDYAINLSNDQLAFAQKNANDFLSELFSNKVLGDDVRIAIFLKYHPDYFQSEKGQWGEYTVKSLLKFLDKDFRSYKLNIK